MNTQTTSPVRAEAMLAYCDSNETVPYPACMDKRNLSWRASAAVPRDEAIAIMRDACPSYNAFEPDLLTRLPDQAVLTLAREGSVCIYVKGRVEVSRDALLADEMDYNAATDKTHIWWD